MKWSFGSAGRALPRSSRAMAGVGTPVCKANLQPGDLVFFSRSRSATSGSTLATARWCTRATGRAR
ncbi:NlpC/P60 family protein [Pseudonocardia charpentierae]|uniref:NlpC/P60 family protein n=1 Tax=Pseudonocardia charpentierae TaxID=3075545 RepID=UPI0037C81B55